MRQLLLPCLALALAVMATAAHAKVRNIPKDDPLESFDIPDDWKTWKTDDGIGCESADQVITVFFEIADSNKDADALVHDGAEWLTKEQKVTVDPNSRFQKFITVGEVKSRLTGYQADHKEYGPSTVGFVLTTVYGKTLVTTYWLTKKDFDKHKAELDKLLASMKPVK